tara:strand:+ start:233 stop:868 length:636 start_codon:yes stop_codon:yes gene_type:complete
LIALFVHGMGRSPLSGWPMLRQLGRVGIQVQTFGYSAAVEDFASVVRRLSVRLNDIADRGDYIVIGHSLGGVLLRAALAPSACKAKQPTRAFLLGSPIAASRWASRLSGNLVFRLATGDCGQLLASPARMSAIGAIDAPTTAIIGTKGITWKQSPFRGEPNDGIVSVSEVSAPWFESQLEVPVFHSWLPASQCVATEIIRRVGRSAEPSPS